MQWVVGALVIFVALAPAAAKADEAATCGSPADPNDGWAVAAARGQGFDPGLICGIAARLEGWEEANPHSVVVARHGTLIYEHYFVGTDTRLGKPLGTVNFDAATKHDMRSLSKSVTSLLVAIAFDRGWLDNLDASVFSFFHNTTVCVPPKKIGSHCVIS
jgi:CubicO group peptidase (beta-lactamase class C family)